MSGQALICNFLAIWSDASQAFAIEFDAMGVVHEAVEYGVGVCGIANNFMPTINGELGGNDRRAAPISFLKDFEKIMPGGGGERLQPPSRRE